MLTLILNFILVIILVFGLYHSYRYFENTRAKQGGEVNAFLAVLCVSFFCFYITVLGFASATVMLFKSIKLFVSAFLALLF